MQRNKINTKYAIEHEKMMINIIWIEIPLNLKGFKHHAGLFVVCVF